MLLSKKYDYICLMVNIYVLELEQGKYYVGKTDHTFKRFNQHVTGDGAKWTKKYKVKDLFEFHRGRTDADENRITLQMMKKYGIKNVRGGSWSQLKLSKKSINSLERRINGRRHSKVNSSKKCTKCGRNNHTAQNCYARTHVNGKRIKRERNIVDLSYFTKTIADKTKEKEKELQVLKSKAEIEKKSNQEEYDRLAEEKKILEEELQNLNMASKETQQSNMMKILEMVSEDDIDFIDDILAATENYIGKVANKMLKDAKKQFNNFWK